MTIIIKQFYACLTSHATLLRGLDVVFSETIAEPTVHRSLSVVKYFSDVGFPQEYTHMRPNITQRTDSM